MLGCELADNAIVISGDLRIQHLESLGNCLEKSLVSDQPLSLDLTGVEEVDTAGLQLVLAFIRSRREIGPLSISGLSVAVSRALDLLGLRDSFAA